MSNQTTLNKINDDIEYFDVVREEATRLYEAGNKSYREVASDSTEVINALSRLRKHLIATL